MSNIISVTGPECSGKTVLSIKLAQEIYEKKKSKKKVIVLSPDTKVPFTGFIAVITRGKMKTVLCVNLSKKR